MKKFVGIVILFALTTACSKKEQKKEKRFTTSSVESVAPPVSASVDLDGQVIHYLLSEKIDEKKPLLIFLHGFPEFSLTWLEYLEDTDLREKFNMVAMDMRGYGLSSKPRNVEDYKSELVAADVVGVAEHLGFKHFHLAGHDWGGIIAYITSSLYPEEVTHLTIMNAPHPQIYCRLYTVESDDPNSQYIRGDYVRKIRTVTGANEDGSPTYERDQSWYKELDGTPMEQFLFGDAPHADWGDRPSYAPFAVLKSDFFNRAKVGDLMSGPEIRKAYREQWMNEDDLEMQIHYYRANDYFADDAAECEREDLQYVVDVPTSIIWGKNDPWVVEDNIKDGLLEVVPQLKALIRTDANHWSNHDSFPEVKRELLNQ